MARVIDQVLGATTSSVVGEITRELVNASDGAGLHLEAGGTITLTNAAAAEFGTSDFSLEFVLNRTANNTNNNVIYESHSSGNNRITLKALTGGDLVATFTNSSGVNADYNTGYDIDVDLNTVTHYALTFDRSGDLTVYKNGNSVATKSIAASSSVDIGASNTNTGRIGYVTTYGVIGTFYRFRAFNKLADAKALYERADVDFADQYGSQTEKVANSGLENWNVANTVPDDWPTFTAGSSAIARSSDAASGSYSAQLSVDSSNNNVYINTSAVTLPAGKTIRYSVQMKGSTAIDKVSIYALGDNVMIAEPALTTSYQTFTGTYTATADSRLLIGRNSGGNGASKSIFVDNASVVQIGCVSDYDLAFANENQSRMVADRSTNNVDGEMSSSGVKQTQVIKQLNSTAMRIGGTSATPATPADGELLVSGNVGVGCDPSYPLEVQSGGVGTVLRAGTDFVSIDSTGTEAEPTLILNGDANTGLWHPAADTLAVSTGGAERMRISSTGLCTFSNGIAFPAPTPASAGTPAASSVLDVFEIGTWTPVLNGVTGGNSTGVYTRIGNMCYFSFYSGSITSTAVDATFSGLPFECSAYYGTITATHNTWVPNADSGYVAVSTHTGKFTPSASISTATATAGTGRYIMFSGYYRVK